MNPSDKVRNQIGELTKQSPMEYNTVAASQTAQVLGTIGAPGDYISHLVVVVATAATAAVSLLDGSTSISVFPNSPGSGIGTYTVPLGISCTTAWKVTTGAGCSVIAVGLFS